MSIVTLNDRGVRSVSAFGSLDTGSMVLIKKLTASSDGTLSFVDGASSVVLDNTYKEYVFTFKDIHPATDNVHFTFQGNAAGGSGYNETITSSAFYYQNDEGDSDTELAYEAGSDQAQGTAFQRLGHSVGNDNDQCIVGSLHLFNPSSTTFVKHFIAKVQTVNSDTYCTCNFTAGYFNTTSAIDEIQFKFSSGNIDAGTFKLYGIKDS